VKTDETTFSPASRGSGGDDDDAGRGIRLHTYDLEASQAQVTEVRVEPGSALVRVKVQCAPGAEAIQLPISDISGQQVACYEVDARPGEVVHLALGLMSDGVPWVEAEARRVLALPTTPPREPQPPLVPAPPGCPLDLAVVVDATTICRSEADVAGGGGPNADIPLEPLLASRSRWEAQTIKLMALVRALTGPYKDVNLTAFAFADHASSSLEAEDLRPGFLLSPEHPNERRLEHRSVAEFHHLLLQFSASSGGDFVDALAEALEAGGELNWRPDARKLLFIFGNSPGHSVLNPPPSGADLHARALDVDVESQRLHDRGVEVLTLFHDLVPPHEGRDQATPDVLLGRKLVRSYLKFARQQYRRLASREELAWTMSEFEAKEAAELVLADIPSGRGATLGRLVEVC